MSADIHKTIMIVDHDEDFLEWVDKHLRTPNTEILCYENSQKALDDYLKKSPDLLITELFVKPLQGMDLIKKVRLNDPNAQVILTTSFPPSSAVIEAMRLGAYDVLRKETLPYDLRPIVEEALKKKIAKLESVCDQLQSEMDYLEKLLKKVGFEEGIKTLKEAAIELIDKKNLDS